MPVLGFASLAREDGLRLADQKAKRASQPKKTITNPSRPRARRSRASHPLWMIPYALNNASLVLVFQACEKKNPAAAAVATYALAAIRFFLLYYFVYVFFYCRLFLLNSESSRASKQLCSLRTSHCVTKEGRLTGDATIVLPSRFGFSTG